MRKFWLVFSYEYRRNVLTWRFLLTLLMPGLMMAGMAVLMTFLIWFQFRVGPVGVVDASGFLSRPEAWPAPRWNSQVQFVPFATTGEARAALDAKEIDAFLYLPPGYPDERQVELVYYKRPPVTVLTQFRAELVSRMDSPYPRERVSRLVSGGLIIQRSLMPQEELPGEPADDQATKGTLSFLRFLFPFAAFSGLSLAMKSGSGYLSSAVVDEKANRVVEVLLVSLSPWQLLSGKITAYVSIGITQILVWAALPVLFLLLVPAQFTASIIADVPALILIVLLLLPATLLMVASFEAMVSSTLLDPQESQNFTMFVYLGFVACLMLLPIVSRYPDGLLAVVLSIFPPTAAPMLLMRFGFTSLPLWQVAAAIICMLLTAAAGLWGAGRIFRQAMLRTGNPFTLREVWGILTNRSSHA